MIISIVIYNINNSITLSNLEKQINSKQDKISTEISDSTKVFFEFNDTYFWIFNDIGIPLSNYNNKTIELNFGDSKASEFHLYNSKNFTKLCVEYAIEYVEFDNIFYNNLIYNLDRIRPPDEYISNYNYQVDCYKLPNIEELRTQVILTQSSNNVKDSIIKFTLLK